MACKILIYKPFGNYLWCGAGLNRRHKDFQSFALPTELPHRALRSLGEGGSFKIFICPASLKLRWTVLPLAGQQK
jgi:hypothetical protein